jgi:hypothetical protein
MVCTKKPRANGDSHILMQLPPMHYTNCLLNLTHIVGLSSIECNRSQSDDLFHTHNVGLCKRDRYQGCIPEFLAAPVNEVANPCQFGIA